MTPSPGSGSTSDEGDSGTDLISLAFECSVCAYRLRGSGSGPPQFCAGCGASLDHSADTPSGPQPVAEGARVLVADDSVSMRRLVSGIVRGFGLEVVEARNGTEALQQMATALPALVITDYHMPGMNGIELLRRMRQDPELKDVDVVMLSRETGSSIIRQAKSLGVRDFLHKDDFYDPADLRARLSRFLQQES